jgi:FkbM family methyltransferase
MYSKFPIQLVKLFPDAMRYRIACKCYHRLPQKYQHLIPKTRLKYANNAVMPHLMPHDLITARLVATGFHELDLTRLMVPLAKAGGKMVDIGANQGYFSLLWLANNPNNSVVSLEASPRVFPYLQANIAANQFDSRATLHAVAAGTHEGTMTFELGPPEQSGWGGLNNSASKQDRYQQELVNVPVVRLDELVTDVNPISVLKVDVEGADTWVLEGATRLLKKQQIKNIFFEQHYGRMAELGIGSTHALDLLKECGYVVQRIEHTPGLLDEFHARLN